MNAITKNMSIVLGIAIVGFAAYVLIGQDLGQVLQTYDSSARLQQLLVSAEQFNERQRILNTIDLDISVLSHPGFTSLESFTLPLDQYDIGRDNPFLPVSEAEPLEILE